MATRTAYNGLRRVRRVHRGNAYSGPVVYGRVWFAVFLTLMLACGGDPNDSQSNYTKTVQARAQLQNGNPEAAEKILKQVAASEPTAQSLINLGVAQATGQNWQKAAAAWQKAYDLDPLNVRSSYHLARWELRRAQEGKPSDSAKASAQAIEYLEHARGLVPRNAAVLRLLSEAYAAHGDSLEATALLVEAERFDPDRAGRVAAAFGLNQIVAPQFQRSLNVTRHAAKFHTQELKAQARGLVGVPTRSNDAMAGMLLQGTRVWLRNEAIVETENIRWAAEPLLEAAIVGGVSAPFDRDDRADIIVWSRPVNPKARSTGGRVRTQLWFVRGGGDSLQAKALFALPYDILDMQALDIDSDGDVDLLAGVSGKPGIRLWRNDGTGAFTTDENPQWFASTLPTRRLAVADLNDDRIADMVSIDANSKLQVWAGRRHGRFSEVTDLAGLAETVARTVSIADLDADGLEDLLLGDDQALWIHVNRGNLHFERNAAYRDARGAWSGEQERGVPVVDIQVADIDNDGKLDVITQHFNDPNARRVIAQGTSRQRAAQEASTTPLEDTAPSRRDVALLEVPQRVRLALWRNEGHGILTDVTVRAGLDGLWMLPAAPIVADFDQDGDLDLACVGADNQVHLVWNRSEGLSRRVVFELVDAQQPARVFAAQVEAYAGRQVLRSAPFAAPVSLGVGTLEQLDVLCIRWADGHLQNILDRESLRIPRDQAVSVIRIER